MANHFVVVSVQFTDKTYLLIFSDKSLILFDRFGASYKEDVENSRIETSKILADYCDSNPRTPKAFINMSGVGMWT